MIEQRDRQTVVYFISVLFLSTILFYNIENLNSTEYLQNLESPWPMAHHDSMHTGRAKFEALPNAGVILWEYHLPENTSIVGGDGIVVDSKGNIYFYAQDHYLYSISINGKFRWRYYVKNASFFISGPVIVSDVVYFLNNPGILPPFENSNISTYLYGISHNGTLKYKIKINYYGSPVVCNNSIYIGGYGGIYKINNGSAELINSELRKSGTIGVDLDRKSLYAAINDTIYATTITGNLKWEFKLPSVVMDDLVIEEDDGTIYITVLGNGIYAVSFNGKLKWTSTIRGSIPAVGRNHLYLTKHVVDEYGTSNYLYAISKEDGEVLWKVKINEVKDTASVEATTPVIGGDGNIYVGAWYTRNDTGYLYSITPEGKIRWRLRLDGGVITPLAIGKDGTLYVGTPNGTLYAIGGEENDQDNGGGNNIIGWYCSIAIGGGIVAAVWILYYVKRGRKYGK